MAPAAGTRAERAALRLIVEGAQMHKPLSSLKRALILDSDFMVMLEIDRCIRDLGLRDLARFTDASSAVAYSRQKAIDFAVIDLAGATREEGIALATALAKGTIPFVFCSVDAEPVDGFMETPVVPLPITERDMVAALAQLPQRPDRH